MTLTKILLRKDYAFDVFVADTDMQVIGVSKFYTLKGAQLFSQALEEEEYDDGQGRRYDILDCELEDRDTFSQE